MKSEAPIEIVEADLTRPDHARHYLELMDHFALDPMAGGAPLDREARERLVPALLARSDVTVLLAYAAGRAPGEARGAATADAPLGLATCIESFSTYAAAPLWNLHDMVVYAAHRGQGVGTRLLTEIERRARERGYCKVTLEVLSGNTRAQAVYRSAGYGSYALDPEKGAALFWERKLTP